jgi:uncharacterized membrane protein YphA (DoxX/SURF4 family)
MPCDIFNFYIISLPSFFSPILSFLEFCVCLSSLSGFLLRLPAYKHACFFVFSVFFSHHLSVMHFLLTSLVQHSGFPAFNAVIGTLKQA